MKLYNISIRNLFKYTIIFTLLITIILVSFFYYLSKDTFIIYLGIGLLFMFLMILYLFLKIVDKKLDDFILKITMNIDQMLQGNKKFIENIEEETALSKINNKLEKLYFKMEKNKEIIDEERSNLQSLISDISHQTKIPISNLKMINDTIKIRKMSKKEEERFLDSANSQLDKLDFLIQSMIKTSRLETGIIKMEKKKGMLYETIIAAVNGILPLLEKNKMDLIINCPEDLILNHDNKWTTEAIFNILDNSVKYSKEEGKININVVEWENYIKIDIEDFGIGISEEEQATIFKRFYRSKKVVTTEGIGLGLYLAREIVAKQGGYIKVSSEIGESTIFSIFLLKGD